MDKLVTRLKEAVLRELEELLRGTPGGCRPAFVGPPYEIMEALHRELMKNGGVTITIAGNPVRVPVYLAVEGPCANPGEAGGKCNDSMLVDLRNKNDLKYLLTLVPPRASLNLSLNSSSTTFGVDTKGGGNSDWQDSAFMQRLLGPIIESIDLPSGVSKDLCNESIRLAGAILDSSGERTRPWQTIHSLVNINLSSPSKDLLFLAACGMPNPGGSPLNRKESGDTLARIATALVEKGKKRFFTELRERANDLDLIEERSSVMAAIEGFECHLEKAVRNSPEFNEAPRYYYSPFRTCKSPENLPHWWVTLDCRTWGKLLGQPDTPPPPESRPTRVEVANRLINSGEGEVQVVLSSPEFRVTPPATDPVPFEVTYEKKNSSNTTLAHAAPFAWTDNSVANHTSPASYSFKAGSGGACAVKIISLDRYAAGVVLQLVGSAHVLTFKQKKAGRAEDKEYECIIPGFSQGARYEIALYHSSLITPPVSGQFIPESGTEYSTVNFEPRANSILAGFDAVDAGTLVTQFLLPSGGKASYSIILQIREGETRGVASEFERLIALNQANSNVCVDVRPRLVHEFQFWALRSRDSYNPVIMGYDAIQSWGEPKWTELPIMSGYNSLTTIRPKKLDPPESLLEYREKIHSLLLGNMNGYIETARLGELVELPIFRDLIVNYLAAYIEWLERAPSEATWFDTVLVVPCESEAVLSKNPDAILLPPYHPLKLAWMVNAQEVLWEAISSSNRCPAAGMLNPMAVPDMLLLQCSGVAGPGSRIPFLSVASNNDYWSVLWNESRLAGLNAEHVKDLFNDEFGICIEGLSSGFSVSQIEKSMKDLSLMMSARSKFKVSISSENFGDSSCTAGMLAWSEANLGSEDPWFGAGKRELEVFDLRDESQHPSSEILANLAAEASGTVRWLKAKECGPDGKIDLGIINHLGGSNYELAKHGINAGTSRGNLTRHRVRFQVPSQVPACYLAEARKSLPSTLQSATPLERLVSSASSTLEGCLPGDSLNFAPNTFRLQQTLKNAYYCAVSSSSVDPATFFDSSGDAYLWDYDLPGYSARPGGASGYFLLASPTQAIIETVKLGLASVSGGAPPGDDVVKGILKEVSGRGICTIKHLATGGTTAHGEIGLLIAARLLAPLSGTGIMCPDDERINLILPIDPFLEQVDVLRNIMSSEKRRPDLLVASIYLGEGRSRVRLTPVEVKFRSQLMSDKDMKRALQQASSFSLFMEGLLLSPVNTLWQVAGLNFVAELMEYAFRVQGLFIPAQQRDEWGKKHSRAICSVLAGTAVFEVDRRGRLIIIDETGTSDSMDLDGDGFQESLRISKENARELLFTPEPPFTGKVQGVLNGWELLVDLGQGTTDNQREAEMESTGQANLETSTIPPEIFPSAVNDGTETEPSGPWSDSECYLAVLAYDLMDKQAGVVKMYLYKLVSRLTGRSPKAVEYKLQNVSACDMRPRELKPINEMHKYQQQLKIVFDWFSSCHDEAEAIFESIYGFNMESAITQLPHIDIAECLGKLQQAIAKELETARKTTDPQQSLPFAGDPAPAPPTVATANGEKNDQFPDGVKFRVGKSTAAFGGPDMFFHPSNTDLTHLNIGIVGDLGTGKTQLIQGLIFNLVRSGKQNRGHSPRFLIFDYKGDYSKESFARAVGARVVEPYRIPLSLFDTSSSSVLTPWISKAKFFIDILDKIFPGMGYPQKEKVKQAIKRSYEDAALLRTIPTINQVFQNYQALVTATDSPSAILSDMCDQELFESDPSKLQSFDEFFTGVTVISLNKLGAQNDTKNMLVIIFLNMFFDYMLKIEKQPFIGTSPQLRFIDSYLLVDEADNIMKYNFDVLNQILLQDREFGVGVMLASQYLSHFKKPGGVNYAQPLLTWFVHKVPNISPNELSALGMPDISETMVNKVKTLQKHECLYKSLNVPSKFIRADPFYELIEATSDEE
ncbi:ATP-binding protein [Geomonas agri]|uniref:ATP-binding protein n=1 Tax=Geomonas agri TaxID=2873702 RepID=UPI001CD1D1D1|nr:type IV secretory system conjugative DNA transfer family protein [Geomonas agri]